MNVFRFFDLIISSIVLIFSLPLLLIIYIISLFDTGNPLFFQERVGLNKTNFKIIKFRTMFIGTSSVATHLASSGSITKFGSFLRKTKLDELPQLWNVLKGDMGIVGPRPNLFNQTKLIKIREKLGIYKVKPGITGLSQLNNIDMSQPILLAQTDRYMLENMCLRDYFKYIYLTFLGQGKGDNIRK